MRAIPTILSLVAMLGLHAWADDATTTPAASDEKAAALAIYGDLEQMTNGGDTSPAAWDALDAKIADFQKQYATAPHATHNIVVLRGRELTLAKRLDPARYDALVQKLSTDPLPEVAALVAKLAALKSKPLDLKFTAVDGTAVDLTQMRGKVVLIDFWATWCPPCRGEVPHVVDAYQKYHDKGFEVVGISLDQDKDALLAFTKANGMVWPQYFDGKGWDNEISRGYGINSIPAMWLVDKKGMLVTTEGRDDLAGQVEKLLAAP